MNSHYLLSFQNSISLKNDFILKVANIFIQNRYNYVTKNNNYFSNLIQYTSTLKKECSFSTIYCSNLHLYKKNIFFFYYDFEVLNFKIRTFNFIKHLDFKVKTLLKPLTFYNIHTIHRA